MKNKPISPVIVGRGMAGRAIRKSLAIVAQTDTALTLLPEKCVAGTLAFFLSFEGCY
jgi:hypothetical protein